MNTRNYFCLLASLLAFHLLSAQENDLLVINEDLQLQRLSEHLYLHISWIESEQYGRFSSNGVVYIQNGGAIMVDSPMDKGQMKPLVDFIQDSLKATVELAIPGHFHDDCLNGLPYLHTLGAQSLSNKRTKAICKQKGLTLPQKTFNRKKLIRFHGKKIVCRYLGPGHAPDNIVLWFPEEEVLFGGCLIRSLGTKSMGNTGDAVLSEWAPTVTKVKAAYPNVKIVIPGHGSTGDAALLQHTIDLAKAHTPN